MTGKTLDQQEAAEVAQARARAEERQAAAEQARLRKIEHVDEQRWFSERIEAAIDQVVAGWDAKKTDERRQRAEFKAWEQLRGERRAIHAQALTGPFSADTLAARGLVAVAAAWPDLAEVLPPSPTRPGQEWLPPVVADHWQLRADGIYRRLHKVRQPMPDPGDLRGGVERVAPISGRTILEQPVDYLVCTPVWPISHGCNPARWAVNAKRGWKLVEVPTGTDQVAALDAAGLRINDTPFEQVTVGALSGDRMTQRYPARGFLNEFITDALKHR